MSKEVKEALLKIEFILRGLDGLDQTSGALTLLGEMRAEARKLMQVDVDTGERGSFSKLVAVVNSK